MSIPAVLVNKETLTIGKNPDVYPRLDGSPVITEAPFEWFIITYGTRQNFDPYLFTEDTLFPDVNYIDEWEEHPDYPGVRQYKIEYKLVKRSAEQVAQIINSIKAERNSTLVPFDSLTELHTLVLDILIRQVKGIKPLQKEQELLDEITAKAAKVWDNKEVAKNLLSVFTAGVTPDLETPDWKSA
jgi:predicted metalloendopeptidase